CHTNLLRVASVGRILERASQQAVDPLDFSNQVEALELYVERLGAGAALGPAAGTGGEQAERALAGIDKHRNLLETLKQRSEWIRDRNDLNGGAQRLLGYRSTLEDKEENVPNGNALSPLLEALQEEDEIRLSMSKKKKKFHKTERLTPA